MECSLHYLTGHEIQFSCSDGHIILTERADPGHDWIFLNPIAGLITKYGGSNSHMAIRCAELGIPAAIGCGEQLFELLQQDGFSPTKKTTNEMGSACPACGGDDRFVCR